MRKYNRNIKKTNTEICDLAYSSLEHLITELDRLGIKSENYKDVEFEFDYSSCFYESDTPGIKAIIKINKC